MFVTTLIFPGSGVKGFGWSGHITGVYYVIWFGIKIPFIMFIPDMASHQHDYM